MQNEPPQKPPLDFVISGPDNNGEDVTYEVINMAEKSPLNDPNCQHTNAVKDTTEELGDAYQCDDCGLGWFVEYKVNSPS